MRSVSRQVFLILLICCLLSTGVYGLGTIDYVLDNDGSTRIPVPVTNEVVQVIDYLGDGIVGLKNPTDIFIDDSDYIYIADTGNNRIVKLSPEGKYIRSYTDNGRLNSPEGVFVDNYGDLYVADTMNQRIVHLDSEDNFIEEFTKPTSELLADDLDFQVRRIALSKQGFLYLIKGQKFMTIDANNEFKGYVGANQMGFSLKRLLIRLFASKEQQEKIAKESASPYNSFDIAPDGMVYAVTSEAESSGQIKKINAVGENIYPLKRYGEKYFNEETKKYNSAKFIDIAVDQNGIVSVLEQYSGKIYLYDQEGELLAVFGGKGSKKGYFTLPVALDVNSKGETFVLDNSTAYIHCFRRTDFMNNVIEAVGRYSKGEYEAAYDKWVDVLNIDVNYPVANKGIAKSLYKSGKIEESMEYYKFGNDKPGYSDAYNEFRYSVFREHFGLVVLISGSIIALIIFIIFKLKKYADQIVAKFYSGGDKK